jgi:hypothetical protein
MILVPRRGRKGSGSEPPGRWPRGRGLGYDHALQRIGPRWRDPGPQGPGRRRRKYRPETLRQKDAGDELALESGRTQGPPKVTGFARVRRG